MSTAIEKMRECMERAESKLVQAERYGKKNLMESAYCKADAEQEYAHAATYAAIAQAEAAERQAAAAERANEIAVRAADPFGAMEKMEAEQASDRAKIKELYDEIARLVMPLRPLAD